jgi:ubiquinone/menaquinone biosynthesis C-methylase UbiE
MTITEHERLAFKDFERAGWGKQAGHYDSFIGQTTQQAVDKLLDAVGTRPGATLLDVASGPGYVAAAATQRGAHATGIDISQEMVSEARRLFPSTNFESGDAEALRYPDGSFDAVVCAFGMLHFPRAGKALAEAHRVLRPGGRFAFTVWSGPTKAKLLALIFDVVQRHAASSVALPAGPGLFMLSDPWVSTALMEAATFTDVETEELPCFYAPVSSDSIFELMRKSMVRATYVYDRQSPEIQSCIEQALKEEGAKALAAGGGRISCTAMLVRGTRAG